MLHGWEDRFEGDLSDVDFVIEPAGFQNLLLLIRAYATSTGWQVCQVFRHETTAAYFICVRRDSPSLAVALDACTDYQRHGVLLIPWNELLASTELLPWGGHKLSGVMEFKYRILKAVAKEKDQSVLNGLVANAPPEFLAEIGAWLRQRQQVEAEPWDDTALTRVRRELGMRMRRRPSLRQPDSLVRIVRRLRFPDGLVILLNPKDFSTCSKRLADEAGALLFRGAMSVGRLAPFHLWKVARSYLVVVHEIPRLVRSMLPRNTILVMPPGAGLSEIAAFLEARSYEREP